MTTAVAPADSLAGLPESDEQSYLTSLAFFRLRGLIDHLDSAFREARYALEDQECSKFTDADLDRFKAFLHAIFPALLGTGMGEAFRLTQLALALEEPGHRFADLLRDLADQRRCWTGQHEEAI
jgi:hypothetical protein